LIPDCDRSSVRVRASFTQPIVVPTLTPRSRNWVGIFAAITLAIILRAPPFLFGVYPTGADYGHHLFFAEQLIATGRLPTTIPYFQLGATEWSILPGANALYALLALASGGAAFDALPMTLVFAAVETAGVYLLVWRMFHHASAALIAALIVAVLPARSDMMAWAGYPNAIALSLLPFVLLTWLNYWHRPSARSLVLTVVAIVGTMSLHHLSTLWIGATLALFSLVHVVCIPGYTLKRLIPAALIGVIVGLPVIVAVLNLSRITGAGDILLSADRFIYSRITLWDWSLTVTAAATVLLTGGMLAALLNARLHLSDRVLIAAYLIVCLAFAFGWIIGLRFFYTRALYFLPLLLGIGAAGLWFAWRATITRWVVFASILLMIGVGTINRVQFSADYYRTLTPRVLDGAAWLRAHSQPDDVVVVGTWWGFHMTRLLERPTMVGLTADLVGNPQELPIAADAITILMGLDDIDAVLDARAVRYVIVKASGPDLPDPQRSRQVMSAHPHMRLVYRNADVLIYERVS